MKFRITFNTTYLLIGINIFFFLLTSMFGIAIGSYTDALDFLGADIYQYVARGEVWRLVSAAFLHANVFHLFLNMYALYFFGTLFEKYLGGKKLFALYIFAGLGGSLLSMLFTVVNITLGLKDTSTLLMSVGASGALFGLLGFFLVTKDVLINKGQLYSLLFLNLLIGIAFSGLIDNWAHIGGLLTGMAFGLINNKFQYRLGGKLANLIFIPALFIFGLSYLSLIIFDLYIIFFK